MHDAYPRHQLAQHMGAKREETQRAPRTRSGGGATGTAKERWGAANLLPPPQQHQRSRHCRVACAALMQRVRRITSNACNTTPHGMHCATENICPELRPTLDGLLLHLRDAMVPARASGRLRIQLRCSHLVLRCTRMLQLAAGAFTQRLRTILRPTTEAIEVCVQRQLARAIRPVA